MTYNTRVVIARAKALVQINSPTQDLIIPVAGGHLADQGGMPSVGGAALFPVGASLVDAGGMPRFGGASARPSGASLIDQGAAPVFWPTSFAAGYRAKSLALANNDPISTLPDFSGRGHTATGTTTTRPLYQSSSANGNPSILYDGIDDILRADDLDLPTTAHTLIAVIKYASPPSGKRYAILNKGLPNSTGSQYSMLLENATGQLLYRVYSGTAWGEATSSIAVPTGAFTVVTIKFNSGTVSFYISGVARGTGSVTAGAQTNDPLTLGHGGDSNVNAAPFPGEIPVTLLFSTALSDTDRAAMEAFALAEAT